MQFSPTQRVRIAKLLVAILVLSCLPLAVRGQDTSNRRDFFGDQVQQGKKPPAPAEGVMSPEPANYLVQPPRPAPEAEDAVSSSHEPEYRLFATYGMTDVGARLVAIAPQSGLLRLTRLNGESAGAAKVDWIITELDGRKIRDDDDMKAAVVRPSNKDGAYRIKFSHDPNEFLVRPIVILAPKATLPVGYRLQVWVVPGTRGMKVQYVEPGGVSTRLWTETERPLPIQIDDEIVSVNGTATPNLGSLREALNQLGVTQGIAKLGIYNRTSRQVEFCSVRAQPIGEPISNRKIHFLIFGQSATVNPAFNALQEISMMDHEQVIFHHIGFEFLGTVLMKSGAECTASEMLRSIEMLQVGPNDTIVFYFNGHGAHDDRGHYFFLNDPPGRSENLYRKAIREKLKEKNVRLTVFISEACNKFHPGEFGHALASAGEATIEGFTRPEHLFLNFRGVIELNSANKGQYGWSVGPDGGIFTRQFTSLLSSVDADMNWNSAIEAVAAASNERFQAIREDNAHSLNPMADLQNQQQMTPEIFQLIVSESLYQHEPGTRTFSNTGPIVRE